MSSGFEPQWCHGDFLFGKNILENFLLLEKVFTSREEYLKLNHTLTAWSSEKRNSEYTLSVDCLLLSSLRFSSIDCLRIPMNGSLQTNSTKNLNYIPVKLAIISF